MSSLSATGVQLEVASAQRVLGLLGDERRVQGPEVGRASSVVTARELGTGTDLLDQAIWGWKKFTYSRRWR
jgi:hypothetical protein